MFLIYLQYSEFYPNCSGEEKKIFFTTLYRFLDVYIFFKTSCMFLFEISDIVF